jgi:hypothetical protein
MELGLPYQLSSKTTTKTTGLCLKMFKNLSTENLSSDNGD